MHRPDHIMEAGRSIETDALGNVTVPNQTPAFSPTNPSQYGEDIYR